MRALSACTALILVSTAASAAPIIDVYMSAPGAYTTPIVGAQVQTFDSVPIRNHSDDIAWTGVGYYDLSNAVRYQVTASDAFGGAGNSGRYAVLGTQNKFFESVPLRFDQPQDYFGMWWSAGDANNSLTFYLGGAIIARFATADLFAALSQANGEVVSLDGQTYKAADYFGKPGTGTPRANPTGVYAYLSFVARGGRFDQVVFGSKGTGFESDNHAAYRGTVVMPGSQVYLETLTPEPGTLALAGAALMALASLRRRR